MAPPSFASSVPDPIASAEEPVDAAHPVFRVSSGVLTGDDDHLFSDDSEVNYVGEAGYDGAGGRFLAPPRTAAAMSAELGCGHRQNEKTPILQNGIGACTSCGLV